MNFFFFFFSQAIHAVNKEEQSAELFSHCLFLDQFKGSGDGVFSCLKASVEPPAGDGGVDLSPLWLWHFTVKSLGELIGLRPSSHKPLTCFAFKRCVNNWLVGLLTCSNRPLKALLKFLKSFIKGGNRAFYYHQSSPQASCSKKYIDLSASGQV